MRGFLFLFIIFIFENSNGYCQVTREYQQREFFAYNILFGGVTAGVGSLINKPKKSKYIPAFCKGFAYGMLGGVINFASKKSLYNVPKYTNYRYVWISNIGNCIGNSIIYNAALHKKFASYWFFDLWMFRFDLNLRESSQKKIKMKLLPNAIIGSGIFLAQKGKFDIYRTLETGILTFTDQVNTNDYGATYMRVIGTEKTPSSLNEYLYYAHESDHIFQFREYAVLNTWLMPLSNKVPKKTKDFFTNWVYLDIPWHFGFYSIEVSPNKRYYYQNFFESEAQFFATNKYVPSNLW